MKQIRFAPIIRVSTEDQKKKKDSLDLQKKQIEQYVKILGGVIPDYCWKYSGQEHATGIDGGNYGRTEGIIVICQDIS